MSERGDEMKQASGDSVSFVPATPEVAVPGAPTALPGVHRGGYTREPTAPLDIPPLNIGRLELEPFQVSEEFVPSTTAKRPAASTPAAAQPPANYAAIALGFAVVALFASLVSGFALPIGVVAVVLGALSLRRVGESRTLAIWSIVLGAVSVIYSAGWLLWAGMQLGLFG